jgi:ABC-type arginine/histidine transport system permease subunit
MALPIFFVPIATWVATTFGTVVAERAFKLAAAVFYIGTVLTTLAGISALVTVFTVPPIMSQVFLVFSPVDWSAQIAVITASRVLSLTWHVFRQAFNIANS